MPRITLTSGTSFEAAEGSTLLEAAAAVGITLPYSCRSGRCKTCLLRVAQGSTVALRPEVGLTDVEVAQGWVLGCVRSATSDVQIEADDLGGVRPPLAKLFPCRIQSLERLAPNVMRVRLRLPPTSAFQFLPGQYIDVIGPDGVRRSYSLANADASDNQLELHVRAVDGGVMSAYWFTSASPNDLLRFHGPHGTFFLRNLAGHDLVFLATGTGIAPIKAMLADLPRLPVDAAPRSVTVFWGGRQQADFYCDLREVAGGHRFIPVLSRATDEWDGARGYVHHAFLAERPDLKSAVVYACGSEAMITSAREALTNAGLPSRRFLSDAFVCSSSSYSGTT